MTQNQDISETSKHDIESLNHNSNINNIHNNQNNKNIQDNENSLSINPFNLEWNSPINSLLDSSILNQTIHAHGPASTFSTLDEISMPTFDGIIKKKIAKRSLRKTKDITDSIPSENKSESIINSISTENATENLVNNKINSLTNNILDSSESLPEISNKVASHNINNSSDTHMDDKFIQNEEDRVNNLNIDADNDKSQVKLDDSDPSLNATDQTTSIINIRKRKHGLISKGLEIGGTSKRNKLVDLNQEKKKSLLEEYFELKSQQSSGKQQNKVDEVEKQLELESHLLDIVSKKMPLTALSQRREGISLSGLVSMGWNPPPYIINLDPKEVENIRNRNRIEVQGEDIPNPIQDFESMRLPKCILEVLKTKGIMFPSPVQCQALPILMSGRDLLGVAYTGSGKTLAFSLPMILHSLFEEYKMPLQSGEGPIGLILCPSRELAKQTGDVVESICEALYKDGHPKLRTMYCIGGHSLKENEEALLQGVHMAIATPGRLKHMLSDKIFNLKLCKYFCLDEADRLIDRGFEQEIREIFDYLTSEERQTVLFSATMPAKIRLFAESALTNHIIVNVGRAGSANTNIVQEVEYVKKTDRIRQLIESLKKSPPPALIFAHNKDDVDEIHEYLLLKGVRAASIHGGKTQNEREEAVQDFISGKKNVLVATDIASKGLDFKNIQHVINYDLPPDIEDYVHRIGRTGRGGSSGLATSYINEETPLHFLLDLRGLLIEANQELPKMLQDLGEQLAIQTEIGDTKGCSYCGGLGHRITQCRKLARDRKELLNQQTGEE